MEFSELFTQSARVVLPMARDKRLVSYFDHRGPLLALQEDHARLRAGIHSLLRGIIECVDTGFVMFSAAVASPCSGSSKVLIYAAGTGAVAEGGIRETLRRLQLETLPTDDLIGKGADSRAEGTCASTGGKLLFVDAGVDGLVLSLEVQVAAIEVPGTTPLPDAAGVTAWLVSPIPNGLDSVRRRLRHMGWHVQSFDSLERASLSMADESGDSPLLLIVAEAEGGELPELQRIAVARPGLWTVLAVVTGSTSVQQRGTTAVDIRVLPLSPMELDQITARVDWRTSTVESRESAPTPLYAQDRRSVLVVDDNEVNQLLADGLLDVLGYEVVLAGNGHEALDACRRSPPDMVLMDVDMPVMNGVEATVHLRAWQHCGVLPPFPIVAATSQQDDATRTECLAAGMDGYLSKPLALKTLADELHRVLPTRPIGMHDDVSPRLAG